MSGGLRMPPDAGLSRREALRVFATGAAALVAGCDRPEDIVPYIDMPEGMTAGNPMFFATSLPLGGFGRGVVVESREGRPIKVHGNALHPASLGATDSFLEASVLDLFDPARPRAVSRSGQPSTWPAFETALAGRLSGDGDGVRLLTGPVASPTLARQILALIQRYPGLRWHTCPAAPDPLRVDIGGTEERRIVPAFGEAEVIVSLGCDFLGPGPGQVATAHAFAAARRENRTGMRLHVLESAPSLTGVAADQRLPATPGEIAQAAAWFVGDAGAAPAEHLRAPLARIRAAVDAAPGKALVLAGPEVAPDLALRLAAMNRRNGAPLSYRAPADRWPDLAPHSVSELATAMKRGEVASLFVLDANPVYALPRALGFAEALAAVPWTAYAGVDDNETAQACLWRLPLNHPLEDWSDLRSIDGTVGLVQPLIAPLHDTRSRHEVLDLLAEGQGEGAREIVRVTWRRWRGEEAPDAFETFWRRALHDGVVAGAGLEVSAPPPDGAPGGGAPGTVREGFTLVLRPSPAVWTGETASNAWLQETPEPFTKQVWGNALWMNAGDAAALGLGEGDLAEIASDWGSVRAPVLVVAGQAAGTVAMHLGYGRRAAGPIGSGVGVDANPLRPPDGAGAIPGVTVAKAEGREEIFRTQRHFEEHGRELLRTVAAGAAVLPASDTGPEASFYPPKPDGEHTWGMVIDLDSCIGCNACVTACQAENNVPVVGPEEVARGRIMHWLRVDAYVEEGAGTAFQPVPCMHCEQAPCEPVCPVAASVHDAEGLNVQVYNRCVGTRFCQANCPYKVRRFNFFGYADGQEYATMGAPLLDALMNPDVTVRGRGVMEKCTYCVQRIARERRTAEVEDRPMGEVRTACQSACPTQAITFGNLTVADSAVVAAKRDPRNYAMLDHLGTRPRTTYLARVDRGTEDET